MADKKRWVVTTSEGQSLRDLKKKLTKSSFAVDQVLDEIGCITRVANDKVADQARSVPRVIDVSPEPTVDIGPPDATVS